VDTGTFRARAAAGGFLEWTEFPGSGYLYGTPVPAATAGDLLLEIELDGAEQVKKVDPAALLVFVVAPSRAEREARLRRRGDDPASIARRLEVGDQEMAVGPGLADQVVVNDNLNRATAEVAGIIDRRRSGT
jgi:guanylate kinase